jgi:hypothetical protein
VSPIAQCFLTPPSIVVGDKSESRKSTEKCIKKARTAKRDEMRAEYKRLDFKKLERGKFYQRVIVESNVVVLDSKVAKAFPNSALVNKPLNDLLEFARKSSRLRPRPRGKITRGR